MLLTKDELIRKYAAKTYIGDSVYIHFDGYHFILETRNGFPDDPSNTISIEPNVFYNLIEYRNNCYREFELLREKEITE